MDQIIQAALVQMGADIAKLQADFNNLSAALTPAVVPVAPTVTSIAPAGGPITGGTPVAIAGTGFTGAVGVSFAGVPARSFSIASDTLINAVTPEGSGAANVVVVTPNGTTATGPGSLFTYAASAPGSPDGTMVYPGKSTSIIDGKGHVWTLGAPWSDVGSQVWGYAVMRDGVLVYGGVTGRPIIAGLITIKGGVVFIEGTTIYWMKDTGSGWILNDPPFGAPMPSPNGASVVPTGVPSDMSAALVDANGHVFMFGWQPQSRTDWTILRDGNLYASGAAVKMTMKAGAVWALTSSGQWYSDNGTNWAAQSGTPS